ncbi:MAG: peroxiredoxin family protein [Deltaproteobacteria bacterium]|nr:peroxiredoxin family protein [Deltaproteobacteria bacterium]
MRLGYPNVWRQPQGYFGWLAFTGEKAPGEEPGAPRLHPGDPFPACTLVILNTSEDLPYLGLPPGTRSFALEDLEAPYLLVELYNELCWECQEMVGAYNRLHGLIAADPALAGRVKMLGLGVHTTPRAVARFRREKRLAFPLFADRPEGVFTCLGEPELPVLYLLARQKPRGWRIRAVFPGHGETAEKLLGRLRKEMP